MGLFQCGSNNPKHFYRARHYDWKSGRLIVTRDLGIYASSIGSTAIYLVWEQQKGEQNKLKVVLDFTETIKLTRRRKSQTSFVPSLTDDLDRRHVIVNVDLC